MDLMPFKQTEVGIIPADWSVSTIADVSEKITVGFVGSMAHLFRRSGIPLLRGQDVLPGKLDITDTRFISTETHKHWRKSALRPGDVVMVRVGYPGTACAIPPELGEANAASLVVVRPAAKSLSSSYLVWVVNSDFGRRQIESYLVGGAQQVLNTGTAAVFKLPLPSLAEQEAIAGALSATDTLIESLEQLLAKKRQIKQGAMQELLSGRKRLPGYGGEWRIVPAGAIGRFRGGNGFPLAFQESTVNDYPFFKVSDMNNVGNEIEMVVANNYVSDSVRKQLGATAFPPNTIVFAKVGAAVFLERKKRLVVPSCLDNNMAGFEIGDAGIDPRFIHHFLLSFRLGSLVATTALPSLNSGVLRAIPVPRPPTRAEQTAIADLLSDMDAELAALEGRLTKARQLKQGMMQVLLTGQIRLPLDVA